MVALSMAGSVSVVTAQTSARRGQATWVGENGKLRFSEKRRVSLDESIETLDDVTSVVGKNDGSLVVVSKGLAAVVQYDAAGNQTGKIGRWGEGPYEYVAPSVARMDGDDLVVYDAGTLKFIVYDKAGNGKDEWKGFTRSITDFDLSDEAIVAFVGGSHDHYMARIGRETRDTLYFAEANLLRSGLMTYEGNGRMGLREQKAYYMYPDEAAVREYDLLSRRERTIRVPDADWRAETASLPKVEFDDMNRALYDGRMVNYLVQNSMALGVVTLEDYTIAMIEDGMLDIGSQVVPPGRERVLAYFIFDKTMNLLDVVRLDKSTREQFGEVPRGVRGNSLLFVGYESDASGAEVEWTYREIEIVGTNE